MGAYVVTTSSFNNKHSCQLFRMGLMDKTTPTLTTPLIRANMNCAVATIFSSLAFLSSSISMANLSRLVAASFSRLALLYSSVSMVNLSCLLATTFSSLRLLSNHCRHLLQSFESCQALVFLFVLSFSFLSEHSFFVHAKAALAYS